MSLKTMESDILEESPQLDEFIEDLVRQSRLKQIEKDFKSIGSIIDTRQVYKIQDPPIHVRTVTSEFDQRMSNLFRRNGVIDTDIRAETENVINAMKNAGYNFMNIYEEFHDEEMIWKTKSSDPKYFFRRKYAFPELQEFYDKLTVKEKKTFKEQAFEAVVSLARKYRGEIERSKTKMDEMGIFHSNANAHRAHCLYLMKLHKGITADNIEDPILRAMKHQKEIEKQAYGELCTSLSSGKPKISTTTTTTTTTTGIPIVTVTTATTTTKAKSPTTTLSQLPKKKVMTSSEFKRKIDKVEKIEKKTTINNTSLKSHLSKEEESMLTNHNHSIPIESITVPVTSSGQPPAPSSLERRPSQIGLISTVRIVQKLKQRRNSLLSPMNHHSKSDPSVKEAEDQLSLAERNLLTWMKRRLHEMNENKNSKDINDTNNFNNISSHSSDRNNSQHQTTKEGKESTITPKISFETFHKLYQEYILKSKEEIELASQTSSSSISSFSMNLHNRRVYPTGDKDEFDYLYAYDRKKFHKNTKIIPPTVLKKKKFYSLSTPLFEYVEEDQDRDQDQENVNRQSEEIQVKSPLPIQGKSKEISILENHETVPLNDPNFLLFMKTIASASQMHTRPLFKTSTSQIKPPKPKNFSELGKTAVLDVEDKRKHLYPGFVNRFNRNRHDSENDSTTTSKIDGKLSTLSFQSSISEDFESEVGDSEILLPKSGNETHPEILNQRKSSLRRIVKRQDTKKNEPENNGFQEKLTEIWGILETSASTKFSFMRKYSMLENVSELTKAIDIWGEVAMLVAIKRQIIKLMMKLEKGYCIPPYNIFDLEDQLKNKIPIDKIADLESPVQHIYHTTLEAIHNILPSTTESLEHFNQSVHAINRYVDHLINAVVDRAMEELLDRIYVDSLPYKDWITKAKL